MQQTEVLLTQTYHVKDAIAFYKKFIYNKELQKLLDEHHLHVAGSVPSVLWELFGAILTGDRGKIGYGSDLQNHEIKSSVAKASFEYQYHLNGGQVKLKEDMKVNHIFISYNIDYGDIEVRLIPGKELKRVFASWLPGLIKNYEGPNRRQRYRKSLPYGLVKKLGKLLLQTRNGDLVV